LEQYGILLATVLLFLANLEEPPVLGGEAVHGMPRGVVRTLFIIEVLQTYHEAGEGTQEAEAMVAAFQRAARSKTKAVSLGIGSRIIRRGVGEPNRPELIGTLKDGVQSRGLSLKSHKCL
jgi:hypothetical protein